MKFSEFKYERPDMDEACRITDSLTERFKKADTAEEQIKIIAEYRDMMIEIGSMRSINHIRNTINTNDPFSKEEAAFFDKANPKLNASSVEFEKAVLASPYEEEITKAYGKMYLINLKLSAKAMIPEIIELMQEENELKSSYQKFNANAKIMYNGQPYSIAVMNKMMGNDDRAKRKEAAQALSDFYRENKDFYETTYDKLVKNRTKQAQMMGFKTYTELGYIRRNRNCYDQKDVENFRRQIINDIVPVVTKLKEAQKNRLGFDKLAIYDDNTMFAEGNPKTFEDADEMMKAAKETFEMICPQFKEYINFMFENELFDAPARPGKRIGAYCTSIGKYHSPFVFLNYSGAADNVRTTFHEFGHGFNSYLQRNNLNSGLYGYSMDIAESHSMTMEFLCSVGFDKFFQGNDADKFRLMTLTSRMAFLCYGTMVDHFQHIVYDHPELTPDERNAEWAKLEKIYRPYLDFDGIEFYQDGCLWQRQQHLYSAPFYYIDYVLAQVVALQFRCIMEDNYQEALDKYIDFTSRSMEDTFTELVRSSGLKVPFEDGALVSIAESVNKIISAWNC